jgi:hypothetical protein
MLAVAFAAVAEDRTQPAADGTSLVQALEEAPLGVVAVLGQPRALESGAWAASASVETTLVGTAPEGLVVVWEELVPERPVRFRKADRVLLALEPLPGHSLWRKRLPDISAWSYTRRIVDRDRAFVRRPSTGSVSLLVHYLALPTEVRSGPDGRRHLLALAAEAEEPLAVSGARRLGGGGPLQPGPAGLAIQGLSRPEPTLVRELLAWVERARPEGLLPVLDRVLAGEQPAAPALYTARGMLEGSLPEARVAWLLEQPDSSYREAAVRFSMDPEVLAYRLRRDEVAAVRGAAALRLAAVEGQAALDPLLGAFGDPDAGVRQRAAGAVASFGTPIVPQLREVALGRPAPERETAVLSLRRQASPEAIAALETIAEEHPDPTMRAVTRLAIGQPLEAH